MEEKQKNDNRHKAKSIANAQLLGQIKALPEEKLVEYAYGLTKESRKQEKQIEKLELENEKLQKRIEDLQKARKPADKYSGYPTKRDYIAKLKFILDRNKKKMTFDEIVEAFYLVEPNLDELWRSPNKSISKIISRAIKFNVVIREKKYGEHGCFVFWSANI